MENKIIRQIRENKKTKAQFVQIKKLGLATGSFVIITPLNLGDVKNATD